MKDNQKNRLRFEKIMNTFAEVYEKKTSEKKNRIFFNFMREFPIEVAELAADRLLNKKIISTFPTIAEWKECCWHPAEDVLEIALNAWYELEGCLIAVKQPADERTLDVICRLFGSWDNFRRSEKPYGHWEKQDFIEMYMKVYRDHEKAQLAAGRFTGQLEAAKKSLKEPRGIK